MSVSLPPVKKKPSEAQIEATINKGGKTTRETSLQTPDTVKHFNIRLTSGILSAIDLEREKRPRKPGSPKLGVSTHDWIVEAILEKLEREKDQ